MNTINGIPIVWDTEGDNNLFGSLFLQGNNLGSNKLFNEISNERALQTPFGKNSMFYKESREVINGKIIIAPDIAWRYTFVHDYDATKLINEFREENIKLKNSEGKYDDEIDFIVYAEKDDITISLGRVLLIKMSDAMLKYYVENKNPSNFIKDLASSIYKQQKEKNTFHFTEEEIADAFLDSIKLQAKGLTDISILDVENFLKNITESISTFLHEDLKFTKEQWDPTLKSDNYLFAKPEQAVNYFVNKCDDAIKEFKQFKTKLETIKSFNIIGFDVNTPYVAYLIKTIDDQIQNVQEFKKWLLENKEDIELKIPYICGVWNGMIEFIAGIIDLTFLALNFLVGQVLEDDINLESLSLRESIEEILDKVLKNPSKIVTEAIEAIKNYKYTRYNDPKLNKYQLQYNEGEDSILAIDLIITIVTIIKGITKLSKQLPKFTKWIDEVLARNGKGSRKFKNTLLKLIKVSYGESELSKIAIQFRKKQGKAKLHNGNIAVVEYLDEAGKVKIKEFTTLTESEWKAMGYRKKPHAERIMTDWILDNNIPKGKVTRIYSELEPCSFKDHWCKEMLDKHFPDAIKEYSYDYPGNLGDNLKSVRDNSIKERTKDMNNLVK
jgi:hypothetical protein